MSHEVVSPAVQGVWTGALRTPGDSSTLGDAQGVYPVHVILLHTGRVLMFSGGWESTNLLHRSWTFDPTTWDPATWDPTDPDVIGRWFLPEFDDDPIENPPPPTGTHDPDIDLFCTHHVQLEDGRILCTGGDGISSHTNDSIHFYDPVLERWSRIPQEMVAPRWYPTATLLPDGSVAVFSGDGSPGGLVEDTELLSPPDYSPRVLTGGRRQIGGTDNAQFMYPGMFLVPGGRLFYVPIAFAYHRPSDATQAQVETKLGNTMSFRVTDAVSTPPAGAWQDHGVRPADMMRQEGTAVLLSPAQAGRIAVIGGGWAREVTPRDTVEILETQGASPAWVPGGQMHRTRASVNAVLLPDGKVLIVGGTAGYKWDGAGDTDLRRFTCELWDPSVPYNPGDPTGAFTETGEMHRSRKYHSSGILLPDGRVLVAAGEDEFGLNADGLGPQPGERVGGSSQRTIEFYEPPYMHDGGTRPTISSIGNTGGLDDEVRYGGTFDVMTPATNIALVALLRPGAPTHHTDTEQRHVPLVFWPIAGGYRARVVSDAAVAPPGYYMVWIVDTDGRPCEQAAFVRLSARCCRLITDRSHFSIHEVEAQAMGGASSFDHAFFVIVEGYRPEQLGVTTTAPTQAQLDAWAPAVSFQDATTGTPIAGLDSYVMAMHLEVADLAVRQRITFEYGVRFTGTAMFPAEGVGDERLEVAMTSVTNGHTCTGQVVLFRQPNPYMLDGATHWLSDDLRVFQIRPGGAQSGINFTAGMTPEAYLEAFLAACDGAPDAAGHPFRLVSTDQHDSRLELANEVDGEAVYNFAVARVRYRAIGTPANDVRLFVRAFTTAATSLEYRPETYPVDTTLNLPQVGASATDVLTIPFFSVPRGGVAGTGDTENVKTLPASGAGGETLRYYGAWLDINDLTPVIADPADGVVKSVQNLIRGKHQCLVAEIAFGPDPIPVGATPAGNENLAQRNLAIVESDNPGPEDSHTVAHTFQFRTTYRMGRLEAQGLQVFAKRFRIPPEPGAFDELMILWGGIPQDSVATLHLPALRADDILAAAAMRYESALLEKVDDHTVRCRIGDVSYVPLPAASPRHVAGLLTVTLPQTVKTGQDFRVVVRQHARQQGRITGAFEVLIPVRDAERILAPEARLLAVLKSIAQGIKPNSLWFPVFARYLGVTGDRVRGLGGDPAAIGPSPYGRVPDGALPEPPADSTRECCEEVSRGMRQVSIMLAGTLLLLLVLVLLLILRG